MVQDTFRRFAEDRIAPRAEHIHRNNDDIPEDIISGLGRDGRLRPVDQRGLRRLRLRRPSRTTSAWSSPPRSCPAGSLGAGGSLITRPEILARALETGGTEAQKQTWLPRLATGEIMAAVAVTEPDYGSDVANIKVMATATGPDGEAGWAINGVKTWCTFAGRADVLMLLARTDPDRSRTHRGLCLFIVPKERASGHGFEFTQPGGGRMEGRAIDTLGYRGMHSYEVSFDGWFVPAENLIGEESGQGRGFYYQMAGFENGRLQTAARAVGRHAGRLRGGARLRRRTGSCSASRSPTSS